VVKKVVITAAGLGTRLLPMTKELPKEMLAVYFKGDSGGILLKPLLQIIFEQLYDFGFRDFCFIVGRGKRAIEDHFTPDWDFVEKLNNKGKSNLANDLMKFYRRIETSSIIWINQPEPKGFGHAILMSKPFVKEDPFLACAGDTVIISKRKIFIEKMLEAFYIKKSNAVLLLQEVEDPRQYGVALSEKEDDKYRIKKVVEKPQIPPSNKAIMPYYIFDSKIIEKLEKVQPGVGGEIQLTDAIQLMIDDNLKVYAVELDKEDLRFDIGTPETYWEALNFSYKIAKENI
jgi:UDP-glucose pyrophosphorylase